MAADEAERSTSALQARAAELEAEAAEARAEAARARAEELRRRIEETETLAAATADDTDDAAAHAAGQTSVARPPGMLTAVGLGIAAVAAAGLLGLTGYLLWQHKAMSHQRDSAAEFAAAARQDVINLMDIDYKTVEDSVKRVLDNSTGRFQANFADTADDFVKALKDEQIITKATVNDTAVESMTGDSAVVLVSATSRREGPKAPKDQQEPRIWRISVTMERDGGQIKMSGVEFV